MTTNEIIMTTIAAPIVGALILILKGMSQNQNVIVEHYLNAMEKQARLLEQVATSLAQMQKDHAIQIANQEKFIVMMGGELCVVPDCPLRGLTSDAASAYRKIAWERLQKSKERAVNGKPLNGGT